MSIPIEIIVAVIGAVTTIIVALIGRQTEKTRSKTDTKPPTPRPTLVFITILAAGLAITATIIVIFWPRPGPALPVGAVIPFWGAASSIPNGYELCDGELVTTAGSPIHRTRKPDLRDSFIKGALADITDVVTKPEVGITHIKDISHSHSAGDLRALIGMHGRPSGFISMVPRGGQFATQFRFTGNTPQASGGAPDFGVAVDGSTANTSLSVDVRPKFVSLFYIIRVK